MKSNHPDYTLVVPAYNEANRIEATLASIRKYLDERPWNCEILVVDDGSKDKTAPLIQDLAKSWPALRLISLHTNSGKGAAVRRGVLEAKGKFVLFTDADNSTPIEEMTTLVKAIENENADIAIGSRYLQKDSVKIKQSRLRIAIGRLGNRLIQTFVIDGIQDTQCGFKLFKADLAKDIFSRQRIDRWGFDIEVLAIAKTLGAKIIEVPVSWFNSSESRLRPIRDGLRTFGELLYIKLNLWSGRYEK